MVIVWTAALLLLNFVRYYGITEFSPVVMDDLVNLKESVRLSIILGVLLGTFYFLSEWAFDKEIINRLSFGKILLLKTVVNVTFVKIA